MKRKVKKGSGRNIKGIATIAVIAIIATVAIGYFIFSAAKEANEVKNFDSYSFHLGNMLSSVTNIVTVYNNKGEVSDEAESTYTSLVDKLYTQEEIQTEDYIACLQYASELNLGDEKELIKETIDLVQTEGEDRKITGETFFGGYAVGAIMPVISIYNKTGLVSHEEYKDMFKKYMELMKRPTEKKVHEFVEKGEDILIFAGI